jgi:ADP-ribose pyrophosphatase YjhB (NUDIX family)
MNGKKFTAKAMCLFVHKKKLLLYECHWEGMHFYRPPGGHIEHGEYAHQAVEREVKEELGAKIKNVKLWRTIENIFATKEKLRHEYVFCFTADFVDKKFYDQKQIEAYEDDKKQLLCWYSKEDVVKHKMFVVPKGILEVLE